MIHGQLCCIECGSFDSIPLVTDGGPVIDEELETLKLPTGPLQDVVSFELPHIVRLRCGHRRQLLFAMSAQEWIRRPKSVIEKKQIC